MKVDYFIRRREPVVFYKRIDLELYYWDNPGWRKCGITQGGYTDKIMANIHWMEPLTYEDLMLEML